MDELNYTKKIGEIENILSAYKKRSLSLAGKVTVLKTLAISKLIQLFTVLPSPPKQYIRDIENIFRNFLWKNKKGRISLDKLCNPIDMGGLNMIHIPTMMCV